MNEFKKIILNTWGIRKKCFNGILLLEIEKVEDNTPQDENYLREYDVLYKHEDGSYIYFFDHRNVWIPNYCHIDRDFIKFSLEKAPSNLPESFYEFLGIENLEYI